MCVYVCVGVVGYYQSCVCTFASVLSDSNLHHQGMSPLPYLLGQTPSIIPINLRYVYISVCVYMLINLRYVYVSVCVLMLIKLMTCLEQDS
jgi:hypothetical protein